MAKFLNNLRVLIIRARNSAVTFLKQEKRDRSYDSWLFILVATLMIAVVIGVVEANLTMAKIFPAKEDRYDVDTVYVGLFKDLCPEESTAPSIVNFEACEAKLDARRDAGASEDQGFTPVSVPTFDEAIKGTPNLYSLMLKNPDLKTLTTAMAAGEFYVVKIKVPSQYVTVDGNYREVGKPLAFRDEAFNPWVLTYGGQRFGQVCFDGRCDQAMREGLTGLRTVFLLAKESGQKNQNLLIFSAENTNPLGQGISEGFSIARSSDLLRANILYWFVSGMRGLRASSWFVALFFLAMFFAVTLRQFRDFPLFAYLAASFALWMLTREIGIIIPQFRGKPQHLLRIWTHANLLFAICQYYFALTRSREGKYLQDWILAHLFVVVLVGAVSLFFDGGVLARNADIVSLIFSLGAVFLPFVITVRHLRILRAETKKINPRTRRGLLVVLARRQSEDLTHLAIWCAFSLSLIINTYRGLGNQLMYFSYTAAGLLLGGFGVMVYYTFAAGKNRLPRRPAAELEYLKDVMTSKDFANHIAKPFGGVLKISDIKNSSLIPADHKLRKQEMLAALLDAARRRQEPQELVWNLLKATGDERQELFCLKNQTLAQDFLEIIQIAIHSFEEDVNLVREYFEFCGLHLAIFAIRDFLVTDGSVLSEAQSHGQRVADMLDFASNEANLLLKYLSKSKKPGYFIVAGHQSLFTVEVKGYLVDGEVLDLSEYLLEENLRRDSADKIKPQLLVLARDLELCFGYCAPKTKATGRDLPIAS